MPLGYSHVILSTVWLKRLGPNLWDFHNQTLKLWVGDKEILYKGVQSGGVDVVDEETMKMLWQLEGVIYGVQGDEIYSLQKKSISQKICNLF